MVTEIAPRRRPRRHDGSSNTETLVFDATETLMKTTSFADITVAKILEIAGVSRANFYHYFASKFDVLASMTAKILGEAYAVAGPWQAAAGRDRAHSLDASLRETLQAWSAHGTVMCAAIEWMHEVPEVAAAWSQMRERFVTAIAEQIRHVSPSDADAEVTATVLVCGLERSFYVSHRGLDARLPSPESTVAPLGRITRDAIYASHSPISAADLTRPAVAALPAPDTDSTTVEDSTAGTILRGLNDLLLELPIQEVSVARILERAGASRATFYFYFASKDDAFLALYRQMASGVTEGFRALMAQHDSSVWALRTLVRSWLTLDAPAAAVFRNAVHEWPRQPDLAEAYLSDMAQMVDVLAAALQTDRAAGTAPDGPPVDAYAATLMWTIERSVAGQLANEAHLTDVDVLLDVLGQLVASPFHPMSP